MNRRTTGALLALAMGACLVLTGEAWGDDRAAIDRRFLDVARRQLMETRAQLAATLGEERLGEVQAAQAEVAELKPWVDFYRGVEFFSEFSDGTLLSIRRMEDEVRQAEHTLSYWRKDDADKDQVDGPQTLKAKSDLAAAKERLRQFKSTMIDTDLEGVGDFAAQGIRTYDELERRYEESQKFLTDLQGQDGDAGRLVRKIAELKVQIHNLELRVRGWVMYRIAHVVRRPRRAVEHMVPKDEPINGGSSTYYSCTRTSFTYKTHRVYYEDFEDWAFTFGIQGMKDEIKASFHENLEFEVEATGSCTIGGNTPEDRLSGIGAMLDARTEGGGIVRIGKGQLRIGLKNQSDSLKFRFKVNPNNNDATVSFFLWNSPVCVTYIYRRE